jgi:hypothetical protein
VDAPEPSQPGASTCRQTLRSAGVSLEEDFAETVEVKDASEDAEESENDQNNSDLDAELGGDDDTASDWDPTDYGQPPETSSLVYLGFLHCRIPTQVKASDGSKVSCVCGKLQAACKRHSDKVTHGAF